MTEQRACPACNHREFDFFCHADDRLRVGNDPVYRILRCRTCGLGVTEPQIDPREIHRWYPSDYYGEISRPVEEYLAGTWQGTSSWRGEREKAKLVEEYCSGGRILDVGCAEGKFLWALDGRRWQRWGLEFNADLVARVDGRIPGIHLLAGSLSDLEAESGGFHAVTLWHVFEHLADPIQTLQQVRRILSPGGLLVISSPRFDSLQARMFRRDWYAFSDVPRHYFHYSRDALLRLLEREGLRPVACRFFSAAVNFHCWKYSLRSWLERRFGTQLLYYPLKPLLHLAVAWERITGTYATITVIART